MDWNADAPEAPSAPGALAKLSDGRTYHEWHGPAEGEVLVLVHGLTTPSFIWRGLIGGLTEAGFRVLAYDLYGRGLSDAPRGAQTRAFFTRQLRELLADQGVTGDFSIMGFSMGGLIAGIFAAEEAERVDRVILIAPAGFDYTPSRAERFLRDMPVLGDWLNLALGGWLIRRRAAAVARLATTPPDIAARQAAATRSRGFARAMLSSQRNILRDELGEAMGELRRIYVPVLAIWGEADGVIPITSVGRLAQANPDARQVTIPGATHWLPVTHPREILAAIDEFRRET